MNCMMCGFVNPISHVVVRKDGNKAGVLCGSHTLAEVILFKKHKESIVGTPIYIDVFDVEITHIENYEEIN